jgi:oxalate decarboxylase/phosphoglucose isomerase-like protein (cupin superfamily)
LFGQPGNDIDGANVLLRDPEGNLSVQLCLIFIQTAWLHVIHVLNKGGQRLVMTKCFRKNIPAIVVVTSISSFLTTADFNKL